jgi:thiol-disulfide isomerase/thioredoxin
MLASLALFFMLAAGAEPRAAPDFEVQPLDGAPFGFAEAVRTHAAVVVVFLSVVCPYSNAHEKHLLELQARYRPRDVMFVGMNSNRTETAEEVAAHARKAGVGFPMMKDTNNRVADLFGARVTPEAFVFDRSGELRYRGRIRSKIGSTDLQDALESVLGGRPVKTQVAKAFGCTIVRR